MIRVAREETTRRRAARRDEGSACDGRSSATQITRAGRSRAGQRLQRATSLRSSRGRRHLLPALTSRCRLQSPHVGGFGERSRPVPDRDGDLGVERVTDLQPASRAHLRGRPGRRPSAAEPAPVRARQHRPQAVGGAQLPALLRRRRTAGRESRPGDALAQAAAAPPGRLGSGTGGPPARRVGRRRAARSARQGPL